MRKLRLLTLALFASVIAGACGFHMRGGASASELGAVQLSAVHSLAATPFVARALARSGARSVDQRAGAAVVLELLDETFTRQTVSYTDQARTAEYEITLVFRFRASRVSGEELVADRDVRASRVYLLDRDNLQGSSQEETLLRDEMSMDLAEQIVRAVDAANRNTPSEPAKMTEKS